MSRYGAAVAMLAAIALFDAVRKHWEHVAGVQVYLLLLACPPMHRSGQRGHGRHGRGRGGNRE